MKTQWTDRPLTKKDAILLAMLLQKTIAYSKKSPGFCNNNEEEGREIVDKIAQEFEFDFDKEAKKYNKLYK